MLFIGFSISLGSVFLPLLAYFLLPVHIFFNVGKLHCEWTTIGQPILRRQPTEHPFAVHTWQIFLAITAVPSLLSGFLYIFMPESPKFLMSQGNYTRALNSLQRIYSVNKRKSRDSYPVSRTATPSLLRLLLLSPPQITRLKDATPEKRPAKSDQRWALAKDKIVSGLKQLSPMFSSPYLGLSLRVYCLHFCQIMW